MRIYTPEEPIPAAAITLATQPGAQQHILFSTRYDVKGYYGVKPKTKGSTGGGEQEADPIAQELERLECQPLSWAIKGFTVSLLRDWSMSTALIYLTCNLPNDEDIPPLPNVQKFRGGNYPYLFCEDEIRIYAGYVASPFTPITGDLLDESPINVDMDWETGQPTGPQLINNEKKLVPIFWGFIDRIDFDGGGRGQGTQCLISCRDRTRVFSDTFIISIPSIGGSLKGSKEAAYGGAATGRKDRMLADIAKGVNGWIHSVDDADQTNCWKPIITPPTEPTDPPNGAQLFNMYEETEDEKKIDEALKDTIDPSRWMRRATHKIMDKSGSARFHMWIQRPPLTKEAVQTQWQITNKSPFDLIQQLGQWEERLTDFFCSHVNGDFVFGPKALDTSGFYDSVRMYRTYFYRSWPKTSPSGKPITPPCVNQQILSMRTYTSTIGTGNRIIVIDASNSSGATASVLKDVQLTTEAIPWSLDGEGALARTPPPPCRNKIIMDGALATYENASGGAMLSALASSRAFSRDLTGVIMTVFGDPTWYPNEAARVYNTFLHDVNSRFDTGSQKAATEKSKALDEASRKYGLKGENLPDYTADTSDLTQVKSKLTATPGNSKEINRITTEGTSLTNKEELILPVYKCRAVIHKMNTQGSSGGYVTEVSLVGDFAFIVSLFTGFMLEYLHIFTGILT